MANRAELLTEATHLRESSERVRQAAHRADSRAAYAADLREADRLLALADKREAQARALEGSE